MRALGRWESEELEFAEQPDEGVTYAEKIEARSAASIPARSASELERIVRALNPHIGDVSWSSKGASGSAWSRPSPVPADRPRPSSGPRRARYCSGPRMEPFASSPSSRRASGRWPLRTISAATRLRGSRLEPRGDAGAPGCVRGAAAGLRARCVGRPRVPGRCRAPLARGTRAGAGAEPGLRRRAAARHDRPRGG